MKPPIYHRMFDYDRRLLPNEHLRSLEEGVRTIEEAKERSRFTIGYPGWGLIYHLLLCHLDRANDQIIVETGTNEGCTTIILAQALIDAGVKGHVHTVELDADFAVAAERNFSLAKVSDRISLHQGNSHDVLKQSVSRWLEQGRLRTVLLDASHRQEDVLMEFELLADHLSDDALVLFDNTYEISEPHEDPKVNGALKTIMRRFGGNLINLEFVSWYTPGLAIWQKQPKL